MKRLFTVLAMLLLSTSLVVAQTVRPKKVIKAVRADKSKALRDIAKKISPPKTKGKPRQIPLRPSPLMDNYKKNGVFGPDPVWQDSQGNLKTAVPIANFEGLGNTDNENILGFLVTPPDPNGDVGPNHYVQMINIVFAVYDKQGNRLLGPLPTNALWEGFGGACETSNDGDPVVLYDPLADRWLLTQFVFGQAQCVAVSETPDPTGAYFRYEFPTPGNDYPKLGVWPDSYTFTYRDFGAGFEMQVGALERDKILVGDPTAQIILFPLFPTLDGTVIDGVLPVDLDGPPPPPGTPSIFLGHQDDAATGAPEDRLVLYELTVDWQDPSNSTFEGPIFLPTDPFDSNLCGARDCIPQPVPDRVDAIAPFMMHRLAFRNMGTHLSMVANHTVDVGDFDDHAGIRWYELRNDGGGWSIFQQGTYAPDSDHRWMGSIAMDGAGNIALGYSTSGNQTFPSIRYAGRTADAPPGELNIAEQSIIEGTGSQISSNRWGDYSSMSVDPADDATFWYTTEYYAESGINFRTRVGAFNLQPFAGAQIQVLRSQVNYGDVLVGETAGPTAITISNVGDSDLTISDISDPGVPFSLSNVPGLPAIIPSFGSESFDVIFSPPTEGEFPATISISSDDADNATFDVALNGRAVDIENVDALVWNPASRLTAQQVVEQAAQAKGKARQITVKEARTLLNSQLLSASDIAAALDANGISNTILSTFTLPATIPANIQYLFVVLGQARTNFVIPDGSQEATAIEDFIAGGGNALIEGGQVWFFDPSGADGHNFGPTFGIIGVDTGLQEGQFNNILGSNIAEGQNFAYNVGTDFSADHIEPIGTGFLVHSNDMPEFNTGVANPLGLSAAVTRGRTIGTSFEFGQLIDGVAPATKTELMAIYLNFFDNGFALGTGPQILASPDTLDFGGILSGVTSPVSILNIVSVGDADLTVSALSVSDAAFSLIDPPTLPLTIPGGTLEPLKVVFTAPASGGDFSATVTVTSDDADDPTVQVNLIGTVTEISTDITHTTQSVTFGLRNDGIYGDVGNGRMSGFQYKGSAAGTLFSGGFLAGTSVNQMSVNIPSFSPPVIDFLTTGGFLPAESDATFNQIFRCRYVEDDSPFVGQPLGINVLQSSWSSSGNDFVIVRLDVFNGSQQNITGLFVGQFADWDIGVSNFGLNRGGFDGANNLLYQFENGGAIDSNYYGIVALDGTAGAILQVDAILVADVFAGIGGGKPADSEAQVDGDYRSFIGAGPFDLVPGERAVVGFAWVAGDDLAGLQTNAQAAQALWDNGVVSVERDESAVIPSDYALSQNYPNPFNPTTTIRYDLKQNADVKLDIFNLLGQKVRTLVNEKQSAGHRSVVWDGQDDAGNRVATGVYVYQIYAGDFVSSRKMVLLK